MALSPQIFEFCVNVLYDQRISAGARRTFLMNIVNALQAGSGLLEPLRELMNDLYEESDKKHRIFAAFDEDMDSVIECLDLTEPLLNGEVLCCICGCKITHENLERFYVTSRKTLVCCSKPGCRRKSLECLGRT